MPRKSKEAWDTHYAYNAKPENIAKRSNNNKARRVMKKEVGAKAIEGKDVHHKNPQRNGGGNSASNLAVAKRTGPDSHRGWKDYRK